jgi:hypothetical protein
VKYRELSYLSGTPVSETPGPLDAAIIPFRETRRSRLPARVYRPKPIEAGFPRAKILS